MPRQVRCFSCGALVADVEGPKHPYMDSAPGCWELYGQILARGYSALYGGTEIRQIIVDSYACQHPGKPERKAIQSVNLHLASLYLVYEKGLPTTTAALKHMAENEAIAASFRWLEPPSFENTLTVADIAASRDPSEYKKRAKDWGRSVWEAWRCNHPQTIALLAQQAVVR